MQEWFFFREAGLDERTLKEALVREDNTRILIKDF
jgi:hypothetical protein